MTHLLLPHPDQLCTAASRIEAGARLSPMGVLTLDYSVRGCISAIAVSPKAAADRVDGLWQHTCFEAFLRASGTDAYYEFNLSPSSQWAAYCFTGYRDGMHPAQDMDAPRIDLHHSEDHLHLTATLDLSGLTALPRSDRFHLGLAAVIEETDGTTSYWALAHPPGKPDFHHKDCFVHDLIPKEVS